MAQYDFKHNEALSLLKRLVRIDTRNPPGNEFVLAEEIQQIFEREGIKSEIQNIADQRANLIVKFKGENGLPVLLVAGHLDTVSCSESLWKHAPFSASVENDFLFGLGSSDMKGSLAAVICALILIKRNGCQPKQDLIFLCTANEEINHSGAKLFVEKGGMENVEALLIVEPSNSDILVANKGAVWIKATVYGKTAHGSMPYLGINAISRMAKFINTLETQSFDIPGDTWLGMPTYSVNAIQGGIATNIIPDSCVCDIDFRILPGQTEQTIFDFLEAAIRTIRIDDPSFSMDYHLIDKVAPVGFHDDAGIFEALDDAAGKKLKQRGVNYSSDGAVLLENRKIPFAIFGPGDEKQAHQIDEHISLISYFDAINIYYNFFLTYRVNNGLIH